VPPRPVVPRGSCPKWWAWAKYEHDLTAETILVLFALCDLGDDEWICAVSERRLAEHVGIARMTARKALTRLVEIGAIVDLGRDSQRTPQRFRVSPSQPRTAAQVRLLATKAVRRAVNDQGDWIATTK
jgi:DNA-binding MarR family transcriptional regulator